MGVHGPEAVHVRRAAELHDVGKVAIPDSILRKAEDLDEEEWRLMQRHSEVGQRILDAAPALAPVGALIRSHHERWDGTGYPDRLAGEDIPLGARIVGLVDAYHAMIFEEHAYKPALTEEEAIRELRACAGTQFDPAVVEAFCHVMVANRQSAPDRSTSEAIAVLAAPA
jgi:two-component system cell cycle response regulator